MYSRWQWLPKICHEVVKRHLCFGGNRGVDNSKISNYPLSSNTAYSSNLYLFGETVISQWSREGLPATITSRQELTSCTPKVWSSQKALGTQRSSLGNMHCVSFAVLAVATVLTFFRNATLCSFADGWPTAHLLSYTHTYPKDIRFQETTAICLVESMDWAKGTRGSTVGFCQQGDEPSASIRHTKFQLLNDWNFVCRMEQASEGQSCISSLNIRILLHVRINYTEIK